jgi:hypothetical protein
MIDYPITGPEKNPATPGSPPRSNLWPEVKRLALLGLAGSIVTGLGTAAYYFRDKIGAQSLVQGRSRRFGP